MTDSIHDIRVWETILHAFLNSFPYMVLALYSFRERWRFGKRATQALLFSAVALQMVIVPLVLYSDKADSPVFHIAISAIHIALIFTAVKEHIGKLIFSVLVLTNLGTLVIVCARTLESVFFPRFASDRYHYTFQIFTILMLAAVIPVVYLLVFRDIAPPEAVSEGALAGSEKASGYMWRYLWLVPAVFYLIWVHHLNAEGSADGSGADLTGTMYLLIIDAGSLLIYRVIVQAAALYEKNTALLYENHVLSIQRLQYDSLNERLENMRRTRHDIRHHAALLKQIRDSGDISALDELISVYTEQNMLDQPLVRCENETVNIVLALYSETAYTNGITFSVKADVPKDIFADNKDLVVLFGNILENAADACREVEGERFIDLTAAYTESPRGARSLTLIVRNSCGRISRDDNGIFRSTKHPGDGIGISSVKSITEKYGGACSFSPEDGVFTVSVMLYG